MAGARGKREYRRKGAGLRTTLEGVRGAAYCALVLGALVHGAFAGAAKADGQIVSAAKAGVVPLRIDRSRWESGLSFETSSHRAWYGVFWTGECGDLPFFDRLVCIKRPSWAEVTQMVLAKSKPDTRAALRSRMIWLGRKIGYEWARQNDERRIHTDDLKKWGEWLKKSADVNGTIDRLAKAVRDRLESP